MKKNRAAGFVVVSPDLRKVLMLTRNGVGDLPKGTIEKGESSLSAAVRECYEESGIRINESSIISSLPHECNSIDFYTAIQHGNPVIVPNPSTGVLEHEWCGWVSWDHAQQSLATFLRPAIEYSRALCNTIILEEI
jgi:8-oxo-dGTP pyrophosphatase MutT (NUDIX family)